MLISVKIKRIETQAEVRRRLFTVFYSFLAITTSFSIMYPRSQLTPWSNKLSFQQKFCATIPAHSFYKINGSHQDTSQRAIYVIM